MLNLEWTVGLDDFVVSQSAEASISTDVFHGEILDSLTHGQHIDQEHHSNTVQQTGFTYLQGAGHEHTDADRGILSSLLEVPAPSQAQSDTIQRLNTTNNSALSHSTTPSWSLPVQLNGKVPKRPSKRKRIKTALSRKKPCLTTSHQIYNEDSSASKNDFASRLTTRAERVKAAATNNTMSSKEPSHDYVRRYRRPDCTPAWEQGSSGFAKDIKIPESKRRPIRIFGVYIPLLEPYHKP